MRVVDFLRAARSRARVACLSLLIALAALTQAMPSAAAPVFARYGGGSSGGCQPDYSVRLGITPSLNPSTYGQTVTFKMRTGAGLSGLTGKFYDGTTLLGPVSFDCTGVGVFQSAALTAGSHTVSSSDLYNTLTAIQVVNKTTASMFLTASSNPVGAGQLVLVSAAVSGPSAPSGTVTFFDGTATLGTLGLATATGTTTGVATLALSGLTAGTHALTATYSGDSNFLAGATASLNEVALPATTTTLTLGASALQWTQPGTFSATVSGAGTPTGSVEFIVSGPYINGVVLPQSSWILDYSRYALLGGTAGITSGLGVDDRIGNYRVQAHYLGDASHSASYSLQVPITITKVAATTTLASFPSPSSPNAEVSLTAQVSGAQPGAYNLLETVTFMDGVKTLGTVPLPYNTRAATVNVSLLTTALGAGTHALTAVYSGNQQNSAATSAVLNHTVNAPASVTLQASAVLPQLGQSTTLTATVTGPVQPTGTVQFNDSSGPLGAPVPLANGTAALTVALSGLGNHYLTASYSGDGANAANTSNFLPVFVIPVPKPDQIVTGASHVLLMRGGVLYAWGLNANGQLGDGTLVNHNLPVPITLANGVSPVVISAGGNHSLALGSDGQIYSWGSNSNGQIGDGSALDRSRPVVIALPGGATPAVVVAGDAQSFAITTSGLLYAWGNNSSGQLGDASTISHASPVLIPLPASFNAPQGTFFPGLASASLQTLAITSNGRMYAWGDNAQGELGLGTTTSATVPTLVPFFVLASTPTQVSAGGQSSMAVTANGSLYGWGNNVVSELGDGTTTQRNAPVKLALPGGIGVSVVSEAADHGLAIGADGNLYAWGANPYGGIGNGTLVPATTPQLVTLAAGVKPVAIAAGFGTTLVSNGYSLAIGSDGKVYSWGSNGWGQLGEGSTAQHLTPVLVGPFPAQATLVSLPNPSVVGQTVSVSAYVGGNVPTGSVQFLDGATLLGASVALSSGSASLAVTGLAAGAHALTARYSGDASNLAVTSQILTQLVNTASTQVKLLTGTSVAALGQSLPLSITVTGQAPTGTVQILDGSAVIATGTLTAALGGTISVPIANLLPGSHSLSARYLGDASNAASSSAVVALQVNPAASALTLSVGSTTVAWSQTVSLTAAVAGAGVIAPGTVPSGTVQFSDNGIALGAPVAVSQSLASLATSTLAVGDHLITAVYSGDANYFAAQSTPVPVKVALAASSTVLTSSQTPLPAGQLLTLTIAVTGNAPTGSLQLFDGSLPIASIASLSGGSAVFTTTALAVGTHSLTAVYAGDQSNAGSTSPALVQVVQQLTTTVLSADSDINGTGASMLENTVLLGAVVNGAAPTGSVTFRDGPLTLGTATVSAGLATLTVPAFSARTHQLTATYAGDGNNTASTSSVYRQIVSPSYGGGGYHTLEATGGLLYSWGDNTLGQLGYASPGSTYTTAPAAVSLTGGVMVAAVAPGQYYSLASAVDGKLYGWGDNSNGQLGDGTLVAHTTPAVVNLPAGITPMAVATRANHALAIGSDGVLYAWGLNTSGQLCDGTLINRSTPVPVALPAGVAAIAIAAGGQHNLIIGSDNQLYACGLNTSGQVGDGSVLQRLTPVLVSLPAGVLPVDIAAGGQHSLAIGSDGLVYAWGNNASGQLGTGTFTASSTPLHPPTLNLAAGVSALSVKAGTQHSMLLASDGTLITWGSNQYGQLGNGTPAGMPLPAPAFGLPAGVTVTSVAAGAYNTLVRGSDGGLYLWGLNTSGQLGNGGIANSASPVAARGYASQTTLSVAVTSATFGSAVTLNVGVAGGALPVGTVQFFDGTSSLGSAPLGANGATLVTSALAAGSHQLGATYSGDAVNLGSSAGAVTLVISPALSSTSLSASVANLVAGSPLTLTASVVGAGALGGSVQFFDGALALGLPVALQAGVATLTTSALASGSHAITVVYAGDANHAGSVSSIVTVSVASAVGTRTGSDGDIPALPTWGALLLGALLLGRAVQRRRA
jgi:alpha-tubulin suppressor-like RCC1 family protein